MGMDESETRSRIVEAGRRLRDRFFVAFNDGNISARLPGGELLVTPTGVNKGDIVESQIVKVDAEGRVLSGDLRPTSELKMHLAVYAARPDVKAVVHAHPPVATGFAACRMRMDGEVILPEVIFGLGRIGLAAYGTPSTEEVPAAVAKEIPNCDALLLSNHGALTVAGEVMQAYYRMEVLEMYARVLLVTKLLSGASPLSGTDVEKLQTVKRQQGWGRSEAASEIDEELAAKIAAVVADVLKSHGLADDARR
jgi:L-fuculose-phosphate aldolase